MATRTYAVLGVVKATPKPADAALECPGCHEPIQMIDSVYGSGITGSLRLWIEKPVFKATQQSVTRIDTGSYHFKPTRESAYWCVGCSLESARAFKLLDPPGWIGSKGLIERTGFAGSDTDPGPVAEHPEARNRHKSRPYNGLDREPELL